MPIVTPKSFAAPTSAVQAVPAQAPKAPEAPRQADTKEVPAAQPEALSPKWAALARREKQMLALDRQIKEREAKLAEREKSYETDYVPKSRLTKETLNVLRENGLTENQLAEMLLAGEKTAGDPTAFVKSELDKIREEIKATKEETQAELKKREGAQRDQAKAQIRSQAQSLIDGSDEYSTIKDSGSLEAIVTFIERTFDEDGVLMDVEEAAKFIEDQLIAAAMEPMKYKKVQERVKAELLPPAPAEQKPTLALKQQQPMQTLTNRQAQSPSGALTAKDRVNRAIMRARGLDPDAAG